MNGYGQHLVQYHENLKVKKKPKRYFDNKSRKSVDAQVEKGDSQLSKSSPYFEKMKTDKISPIFALAFIVVFSMIFIRAFISFF